MIYLITNRKLVEPEKFLPIIEEAANSGIEAIILREKDLNYEELLKLALKVKTIASAADISLIINGNAQVAKDIQADGLQIGFKDFMESKPYFAGLIGVSVHSLEEAVLAEKNRADYVLASHIFPTACKKGLAPKGIPWLREISSNISIPVIALGGINLNNIKSVFESQVQGVALMSGIMCANDISRFVGKLKLKIKE